MQRLSSVHWSSSPPTSVDEELAAYDDGSVWLVIRSSRDGRAVIGTWSTTPAPDDHAALAAAGDVLIQLPAAQDVPAIAETLRLAALDSPVATAEFFAAFGDSGTVTLAALGGGNRSVQFELDPISITVHLESGGATTAWFEASPPATGFITPDATGLGGLGRRAQIDPGVLGSYRAGRAQPDAGGGKCGGRAGGRVARRRIARSADAAAVPGANRTR